mgnify:CR=1 FL=1
MKAALCVLVALAGTFVHSLVQDKGPEPPSLTSKNLNTSNLIKAEHAYYFIAPTTQSITYQAYCSFDQENWVPLGSPYSGNGSPNMISFGTEIVENSRMIYMKLEVL